MKKLLLISCLFTFLLSVWAPPDVHADAKLETLLAPRINRSPESLQIFLDQTGSPSLAYDRQSTEGPGELSWLVYKNRLWSSPVSISLPNGNFVALQSVRTLSNGIPLMIFSWDKTNYIKLFGMTIDLNNPPPLNTPFPMSDSDLEKLMDQNRQLFTSFQINGTWSAPLPIPGTYRPLKAIMETGPDNSAIVVFWRDEDGDLSTVTDEELYALTYSNNHWSTPVRLTTNNQLEYEAQVKFIGGKYFAAWSSDADTNLATKDDKQIFYAVLTKTGAISAPAGPVTSKFTGDAIPAIALGSFQGVPLLLWMNGGNSQEDPRQTVWESRFNSAWSAPADTGLKASSFHNGIFHEISNGSLLLFKDGGIIRSALRDEKGWSGGEPFFDIYKAGLDAGEATFILDGSQNIQVGILGHVPSGKTDGTDANDPDGVYATSLPLLPDLMISSLDDSPPFKFLGKEARLNVTVVNQGSLPGGSFKVNLSSQGKLLQTLSGTAVNPGSRQNFSATFVLDKPSLPLELEIESSTPESDQANNKASHLIKILPDYFVRSVTKKDETTLVADIREKKGIASAPVSVEFSLVEGDQRSIITQTVFDPNNAVPVEVNWSALSGKKDPFRVEVTINKERRIAEDDYADNGGSYLFNPLPDFSIVDVSVANNQINLTLKNEGEPSVAAVGLMVTGDPVLASSTQVPQQGTPVHYETVAMNGAKQTQVSVDLTNIPGTGDYLYAVVNPGGTVQESNRNNNLVRIPRRNTIVFAEAKLEMSNLIENCQGTKVTVSNNGKAPALYSRVELLNDRGFMIQDRVLSGINPAESKDVEFTNLLKGTYTLRLTDSTQPTLTPLQMVAQVGVPKEEICDGIDNNCDGKIDEGPVDCPPASQNTGQTPSLGEQPQTPAGGDQDTGNTNPSTPFPGTSSDSPHVGLGGGCSLMRETIP